MKIKGSYILALLITIIVGLWLYSGELVIGGQSGSGSAEGDGIATPAPAVQPLLQVRVHTFLAEPRTDKLTLRGRTQTDARVSIMTETAGLVESIPVRRGDRVKAGDIVCRIEPGARQATLIEAMSLRDQAKLDHESAVELEAKGHTAETRVRALKAQLDAADAKVMRAQLDRDRTILHAPFDGIVEHDDAEIGAYLSIGDVCVTLIALDPILVVGQVSERNVGKLDEGMVGTIKLVSGETLPGEITFISPSADPDTRTFQVELEIANTDYSIRDNLTADIEIELAPVMAHRFTPAILTLDDTGRIGVKAVVADGMIEFIPVNILGDTSDGVWVSGLPDTVTLVTVGQEYVVDGQQVDPKPDTAVTGSSAPDQGSITGSIGQ